MTAQDLASILSRMTALSRRMCAHEGNCPVCDYVLNHPELSKTRLCEEGKPIYDELSSVSQSFERECKAIVDVLDEFERVQADFMWALGDRRSP